MKTILQGWNIMRALRLVIGTAILVQGIVSKETMTILLGGLFGGLALQMLAAVAVIHAPLPAIPTEFKKYNMKNWIVKNKRYFIGGLVGAIRRVSLLHLYGLCFGHLCHYLKSGKQYTLFCCNGCLTI